jgi:hypothetical protein
MSTLRVVDVHCWKCACVMQVLKRRRTLQCDLHMCLQTTICAKSTLLDEYRHMLTTNVSLNNVCASFKRTARDPSGSAIILLDPGFQLAGHTCSIQTVVKHN